MCGGKRGRAKWQQWNVPMKMHYRTLLHNKSFIDIFELYFPVQQQTIPFSREMR